MKSILVTGASTGIGAASVLHLDRLGHRVYAGVRKEADGERLAEQGSSRLRPVILDVTDQAHVDAVAKQIADDGGLYGVVNNAGVARGGPLEFLPLDEWRDQFEVNILGQIAVTKATLAMIREQHGRVVFIGSIGGRAATAMMGPYNASKFAIEAVGESLRGEVRGFGVEVSVIEPGAIKTEIWTKGRDTAARLEHDLPEAASELYREHIDAIRKGIDMMDRQAVGPEKVAKAVEHALFAARPRTRYVVGVDARVQSLMVRLLPDRVRAAIIRKISGL